MDNAQKVKIKDWKFINSHVSFVNPVPEMEPWCGKTVTLADCLTPAIIEGLPAIYSILEDEGKFMWDQEWLENVEE